jgi:hypothetical protein
MLFLFKTWKRKMVSCARGHLEMMGEGRSGLLWADGAVFCFVGELTENYLMTKRLLSLGRGLPPVDATELRMVSPISEIV